MFLHVIPPLDCCLLLPSYVMSVLKDPDPNNDARIMLPCARLYAPLDSLLTTATLSDMGQHEPLCAITGWEVNRVAVALQPLHCCCLWAQIGVYICVMSICASHCILHVYLLRSVHACLFRIFWSEFCMTLRLLKQTLITVYLAI